MNSFLLYFLPVLILHEGLVQKYKTTRRKHSVDYYLELIKITIVKWGDGGSVHPNPVELNEPYSSYFVLIFCFWRKLSNGNTV